MTHDLPRHGKERPAELGKAPTLTGCRKHLSFEGDEQVVGQHPDPEPDGVGVALSGRHIPHPHMALEPFVTDRPNGATPDRLNGATWRV